MVHSFAYRAPRIPSSLPVEFLTGEDRLFGFTRDISEHGLSANFGEPVLPATVGRLRLKSGNCLIEVQAEVTHTEGFTAGLAFVLSSERERLLLRAMLQALAPPAEHQGGENTPS